VDTSLEAYWSSVDLQQLQATCVMMLDTSFSEHKAVKL